MAWYNESDEAVKYPNAFTNNLVINGIAIGHMLRTFEVQKIKQVANAKTTTDGVLVYDKIPGWTYKLSCTFLPLTDAQFNGLTSLFNNYEVTVSFLNPYSNTLVTDYQCYPNDQQGKFKFYYTVDATHTRKLMEELSINLIGIRPIT